MALLNSPLRHATAAPSSGRCPRSTATCRERGKARVHGAAGGVEAADPLGLLYFHALLSRTAQVMPSPWGHSIIVPWRQVPAQSAAIACGREAGPWRRGKQAPRCALPLRRVSRL